MTQRNTAWRPPPTGRVVLYSIVYLAAQLADAGFTAHAIINGHGYEVMPIARWLICQGWPTFLAVKLGLTLFSLGVLAGFSQRLRLAWFGLRLAAYAYAALAAYHVIGTVYVLA